MVGRPAAAVLFVLATVLARTQLPTPQKLSAEDNREFHRELERLRVLLSTANDKAPVELQIANTYAAGGQFTEALRRLRKVVDANLGFDPSRDPDFANLRDTNEFRTIMEEVRHQTPPVLHSRLIATINEQNVFPENIAFDSKRNAFLLGSTAKAGIVRCSLRGNCDSLARLPAGEQGYVLGLKIDHTSDKLWATDNGPSGASLRRYDIETGTLEQTAHLNGEHVFNDLALSSNGMIFASDTKEGSVYKLDVKTNTFHRIAPAHKFTSANGIALSADESMLYVSAWGDGLEVIDLPSETIKPVRHSEHISLAFIDGLYAVEGSLIAIQNGPMLPRVVQFRLSRNGQQIVGMTILERRNPIFDGITTGTLAGGEFYYVANPQIDKKGQGSAQPLQVLGFRVVP